MNSAHVVLIPKVKEANLVSKFGTISSLNVVYKIVTKLLTTRLNSKLDLLIDTSHADFVKGGYNIDGVAAAQELISSCYRDKIYGGMLLKLDFSKAYDMLHWDDSQKFWSKMDAMDEYLLERWKISYSCEWQS